MVTQTQMDNRRGFHEWKISHTMENFIFQTSLFFARHTLNLHEFSLFLTLDVDVMEALFTRE